MKNDKIEILKLSYFYKYLGRITLLGTLIIGVHQLIYRDSSQTIGILIFILVFGLSSIFLIQFEKFYRIQINETDIHQKNILGNVNRIEWKSIKAISFNNLSLELKIKDENSTIRIHSHSIGFLNLVLLIEKKTNFKRTDFGL